MEPSSVGWSCVGNGVGMGSVLVARSAHVARLERQPYGRQQVTT